MLGPLLLSMGYTPRVAAATANLMIFLSSSAAAAVYGLSGLLNMQMSLIFGLSCMVSSFIGMFVISRLIEKSGKSSIVLFLLSSIVAIGAALTATLGLKSAIQELIAGKEVGFHGLCD